MSEHEHEWGPWTPTFGPNLPPRRGCLTCPQIQDAAPGHLFNPPQKRVLPFLDRGWVFWIGFELGFATAVLAYGVHR